MISPGDSCGDHFFLVDSKGYVDLAAISFDSSNKLYAISTKGDVLLYSSSTPPPPTPPTPGSSLTPVQISALQTLYGISAAEFDDMAQGVFKEAVSNTLGVYYVKKEDIIIKSYSRRMLHDESQSRILSGQLQVSYLINFFAQSGLS
jgi:hypothetical protein